MAPEPTLIVNVSRGNIVCEQAVIADRPLRRMRGLLGRRELPVGDGILLQPAPSIHTAFMRFPIDVVLIDRNLEVIKLVEEMPAWRTASARRARSALELAAGEIARREIAVGDQLAVVAAAAGSSPPITILGVHPAVDEPGDLGDGDHGSSSSGGEDRTTHVLVLGSDRRFRSLAALLLTRRGCTVSFGELRCGGAELPELGATDVVLLDAMSSLTAAARDAAQIEKLDPRVGVVVVGEEPGGALATIPVVAKWGSFDDLYGAIERARPARAGRSLNGGS